MFLSSFRLKPSFRKKKRHMSIPKNFQISVLTAVCSFGAENLSLSLTHMYLLMVTTCTRCRVVGQTKSGNRGNSTALMSSLCSYDILSMGTQEAISSPSFVILVMRITFQITTSCREMGYAYRVVQCTITEPRCTPRFW